MIIQTLIAALLLTAEPDIELKQPIEWPMTIKVTDELVIRSYYVNLELEYYRKIVEAYALVIDKVTELKNVSCVIKPLDVRIISEEQMNSPDYFESVNPSWYGKDYRPFYGRYFAENEHMYLTLDAARNKREIMHEMIHYVYDICGIPLTTTEIHDKEIREFWKSLR